jgi:DNA polymerase III subunit delta
MHLPEFQASLKANRFHPHYFFFGSDPYLVQEAKTKLLVAIQEWAKGEILHHVTDLDETPVAEVINTARNLPLFAPRQIISVKSVMKLRENQARKLEEYFKNPSPFTTLIFVAGRLDKDDKKKKVFEVMNSATQVVELSALTEREIKGWIAVQVKAAGASVEAGAIDFLLESQGSDLGKLSREIEKLILYAGSETRITLPMVAACSGFCREHTVYEFLDAVVAKEKRKALRLVGEMMSDGSEALTMISVLSRQLRQLLQIRELSGKLGAAEIGKQIGLNRVSPFLVDKMANQAKRFSPHSLALAISRLAMLDDRIKRSSIDSKVFMEQLIHDLTK